MKNRWAFLAGAVLAMASWGAMAAEVEAPYLGFAMGTLIRGSITGADEAAATALTQRYSDLISDYETLLRCMATVPCRK